MTMHLELQQLLRETPYEISLPQIQHHQELKERVAAIDLLYAGIIGYSDDTLQFCPNDNPPTKEELLGWIWAIRPDLCDAISELALPDYFRHLINCYDKKRMHQFWNLFQQTDEKQLEKPVA